MAESKLRLAAQVRYTVLEDEAIMIAQDEGVVHVVNRLGAFLLPLLDGSRSLAELVEAVVDEFEVDAATARSDLQEFLSGMHSLHLLDASGGTGC